MQANKKYAREQKRAREQKTCKGTKNLQREQKNFLSVSQNEDCKGHMGAKCYLLWHIMLLQKVTIKHI